MAKCKQKICCDITSDVFWRRMNIVPRVRHFDMFHLFTNLIGPWRRHQKSYWPKNCLIFWLVRALFEFNLNLIGYLLRHCHMMSAKLANNAERNVIAKRAILKFLWDFKSRFPTERYENNFCSEHNSNTSEKFILSTPNCRNISL